MIPPREENLQKPKWIKGDTYNVDLNLVLCVETLFLSHLYQVLGIHCISRRISEPDNEALAEEGTQQEIQQPEGKLFLEKNRRLSAASKPADARCYGPVHITQPQQPIWHN